MRRARPIIAKTQADESQHHSSSSRSANHAAKENCIYIDTREPFTIILYRHKNCARLKKGFWHIETLDGRPRMGNVLDRSPTIEKDPGGNHGFPFPKTNDAGSSGRSHVLRSLSDDTYDRSCDFSDDDWVLCGYLRQKVDQVSGVYSLRLSPSMKPSKDDHILDLTYHDSKIQPSTINSLLPPMGSTVETPVLLRHKRPDIDLSESPRPNTSLTPVAFRVSQMSIDGQVSNHPFPERRPRTGSATNSDPVTRKVVSHKRKLINGSAEQLQPRVDHTSPRWDYISKEQQFKRRSAQKIGTLQSSQTALISTQNRANSFNQQPGGT